MGYQFSPIRLTKIQSLTTHPADKNMEKSLHLNRWEYKLLELLGRDLVITIKITNAHILQCHFWESILQIYIDSGMKCHKIKILYCSITCNAKQKTKQNKKLETTCQNRINKLWYNHTMEYHTAIKRHWKSSLCTEMEWSPRYTDYYKRAKRRTVFISIIWRTFKCISLCFEKLWQKHKKLVK